ncbi:MAG: DNA adenine methylase [Deltaproteobacteria bacterium]|jgi:DNA adenine methylase|nr:DNA adenine methylase [Deltaproteobacteria bacterium]
MFKPFLKWAGGKRQILPIIHENLPEDIQSLLYFEPFVGGGALFCDLRPRNAVLNDFNPDLILCYRVIRDDAEDLVKALKVHKELVSKEYYYQIRDLDKNPRVFSKMTDVEKAARLIFLNKTCFNGLYRVNSSGYFNVPYAYYSKPIIFIEPNLLAFHMFLNQANVTIRNEDFEEALTDAGKGSFVYFDPPYHSPEKKNFTKYQKGDFREDDQVRLSQVYEDLSKRGAKCLLSNSDTPLIRELYQGKGYNIIEVQARRFINANPTGRGSVSELLIRNY